MKKTMVLAEFDCQGHRFAVPVEYVRRVVPSARLAPLPGAPEIVLGMLDLGDETAVIVNFFQRVGLPFTGIGLSQQVLLLDITGACVGLIVDRVNGARAHEVDSRIEVPEKFAASDYISSIIRTDDGLCIICDPEKFLLDDEKVCIDGALAQLDHAAH
ncbi:purine-binding chemotaxis protein CheW [Paucimonas lemoignei]|uniref:Purine-binding chemotaxis protein CheW n=1 Tax=Paucimonas lemoignei TaxID=29443 RepID=A0A4R3HYY9_PAULE|nr:chemotaxis protein CheW [Paucimonas lemoignei]TCS38452.1 purine-binding chemotaxis protein CheW [Paucimonas lemoignei]